MSNEIWRIVLAIVVATHGIGHVLFLVSCLGIAQWGQSSRSWLLTNLVGDTPTRAFGSLLWLAVIIGFMAAGLGIWEQQQWWRMFAVGSAVLSLLTLALFAAGLGGPMLNAALMDVAILVALLVARWPSASLIGS